MERCVSVSICICIILEISSLLSKNYPVGRRYSLEGLYGKDHE